MAVRRDLDYYAIRLIDEQKYLIYRPNFKFSDETIIFLKTPNHLNISCVQRIGKINKNS